MLQIKDHVVCRRCQLVRFMDLPSSRLHRVILLVEVPNRFKLDGLKRIAVVERSSWWGMASFLPDTSPTFSLPRMDRVNASKKTVVDIRFFYRAVHYEAKKGRRPRGRRKRGRRRRMTRATLANFWPRCQGRSQLGSTARGMLYMEHNAMGVVMAE